MCLSYCDVSDVGQSVNDSHFRKLEVLSHNFYEISKTKKSITMDLPIQIEFFVNQYAKLRMLQFYYDFIDKFLDRADFEYYEMDTDSAYVALSGKSVKALVKPQLRNQYQREKYEWFTRDFNAEVSAYDKHTPGLLKTEFAGDGIISLCSKMYSCFNNENAKFSCKGMNKATNAIPRDTYLRVLRPKRLAARQTEVFVLRAIKCSRITQAKNAFAYFYGKRKVLDDI